MAEPRVAVQLYTLRNAGLSFPAMLEVAANAGCAGVETVGTHDLEPSAMRQALDQAGLEVCSSHVALASLESDLDAVAAFQSAVGNPTVIVPWLPEPRPSTSAGWTALGRRLAEFGTRLSPYGLDLGYHNHDFEMRTLDGRLALDWLMEGAGDGVELELDIAWVARAGRDPMPLLERFADRIHRVHVKDIAPGVEAGAAESGLPEGGWADVGHGTLDWGALLPRLARGSVRWSIIEHDEPDDAARSVARSAAFLLGEREG